MNGGAIASNGEPATSTVYSFTNGGWNSGTGVYTPTSGNPSSTVTVNDWASVFIDGATAPVFIAKVTAVSSTTVTVSTTLKAGTAPTTAGTGISINVGGAWSGPATTVNFPFNFASGTMVSTSDSTRVNIKNDKTYSITATLDHQAIGPVYFQGYTTTFNDGGKSIIDGGTTGASYTLATNANSNGVDRNFIADLIFQNNGATGTAAGLSWGNGTRSGLFRVVVHDVRGQGFASADNCYECEAYACNKSNDSVGAGFSFVGSALLVRCVSHDNTGSNSAGFYTQAAGSRLINCISDTNGGHGFWEQNITGGNTLIGCDFYNNTGDGYQHITSAINSMIVNCNFISNGGYGINISSGTSTGYIMNCGFYNNTSGAKNNTGRMQEFGTVTYGAVPYTDAPNGDFRLSSSSAKGTGRGSFTQTSASYTGTIGYPDIGAAQHQDTGGSTGPIGQLKQFNRGTPY